VRRRRPVGRHQRLQAVLHDDPSRRQRSGQYTRPAADISYTTVRNEPTANSVVQYDPTYVGPTY